MIVRAPIYAQAIWLLIVLAPYVALALLMLLGPLGRLLALIAAIPAIYGSCYLYLGLVRHTRRRVLQTLYRFRSRTEKKPFVLISRSYDQSEVLTTHSSVHEGATVDISLIEALIFDISYKDPIIVFGDKDLSPDDPAGRALYMCAWPKNPDEGLIYSRTGELIDPASTTWEQIFTKLAKAARIVLVVPAASEGVLNEISLLRREQMGSKTVVYMWPCKRTHPGTALSGFGEEWNNLVDRLREHGLSLPVHNPDGGLLLLNNLFEVEQVYPFRRVNILKPLEHFGVDTATPLCRIAPLVEVYEIAAGDERFERMWQYPNFRSE